MPNTGAYPYEFPFMFYKPDKRTFETKVIQHRKFITTVVQHRTFITTVRQHRKFITEVGQY